MTPPTSPPLSDAELLAEFAAFGKQAPFADVVRRHGGMVLSVCRSVLGNTTDAEDAAQAVFLTLAQKAKHSAVQTHLVAWLHRVAWYVAARAAQARAIRRRHEKEAARMANDLNPPAEEPVQLDRLHAGLNSLPEKYRLPLILHHIEGRSHAETAALLGCSVEAVAVRLHRSRELLKKRLDRSGVSASLAALSGAWIAPAFLHASPAFISAAANAASASAAGHLASSALLSGQTIVLSHSAIKMLLWTKLKVAAIVLAIASIIGSAAVIAVTAFHGPSTTTVASPAEKPAITAQAAPHWLTGVLTRADSQSIDIQPQSSGPITVAFNAATLISVDEKPAASKDLKTNMNIGALFRQGQPAVEIRAYNPGVVPTH